VKSYKLIPHVADVRLAVEGSSYEELFLAALEGMGNLIKHSCCSSNKCNVQYDIQLSSGDVTSLLIDFLSAVLTQTHINQAVYCKVTFSELTEKTLKATIFGNKVNVFDEDIKAVTYHEANIRKNEHGNYSTVIVFDI
jgi:SHS2 domain-containing protein